MSSLKATLLPTNVGMLDRGVRLLLGVGLLSMAFTGPQSAWGFIGFVPILTAMVSSCPLYTVLGLSTCQTRRN